MNLPNLSQSQIETFARQLLNNELLDAIFNEAREDTLLEWESASTSDKREQCWHHLKGLERAQSYVRTTASKIVANSNAE